VERAVFINYRGEDSHSYGALLYTELKSRFGKEQVFPVPAAPILSALFLVSAML
jgi:hypothetical protein